MADKKFSQLNAATTIFDADDFAVVQDGETKQANAIVVKTYVKDGLSKSDVGLGNVDNTSDATKNSATATLTNKTLTSPVINGGTINNAAIGGTTPAAGNFTTLSATGNVTLGDASGDTLTINGTAVSIPNGLNFDSNTLFIDATNNRVGVGTSSPQQPLEVVSIIGCRGSSSAAQAAVWAQGSDYYSGPSYKGTSIITWGSAATGTDAGITRANLGSLYFQNLANALIWSNTSIPLIFANRGGTETMRIDSSGNVGIGTSSPGYKLDVVGQVRSNPSSGPAYILAAGGTNLCSITSGNAGSPGMTLNSSREVLISTGSLSSPTGFHQFGPNGGLNIGFSALNMYNIPVNGMSIVGSVGIGKDIPAAKLHVSGTAPAGGIYVEDSSAAHSSPVVRVRGQRGDTNGSQVFSGGLVLERYASESQIASGNVLGTIYFGGNYSGSSFGYTASISAISSANWSSTTTANTDLVFLTGSTAQTALDTANVGYGTERLRITSAGSLLVGGTVDPGAGSAGSILIESPTGGLGYGTGSGGTVTQATSKSTAVTLNKPTGQITMNNAALAAGAFASFRLNTTAVAATDVVVVAISGGVVNGANYSTSVEFIGSGYFFISLLNKSGGSLSEAVVINFAVIKGATS